MLAIDSDAAKQQLTDILNSTYAITQWSMALANIVLPPMDSPPAWYQQLGVQLGKSGPAANDWATNSQPQMLSSMTQAFVDYNNLFSQVADVIVPLIKNGVAPQNTPGAQPVRSLTQYLNTLLEQAATNQQMVQKLRQQMQAFHQQMLTDLAAIQQGMKQATQLLTQDRGLVQQVQNQLQAIELTLAADSDAASAAALDSVNSLSGLAVSFAFGMGIEPIGLFVAVLGIGVDLALNADTQSQVATDLQQITTLQAQLSTEQLQLGFVQGIVSTLQQLQQHLTTALATFDDFDDTWSTAANGLSCLLVVLAQPALDLSTVPDLAPTALPQIAATWADLSAFATKAQSIQMLPATTVTISAATT